MASVVIGPDDLILPQLLTGNMLLADVPGLFGAGELLSSYQVIIPGLSLIKLDFQFQEKRWRARSGS